MSSVSKDPNHMYSRKDRRDWWSSLLATVFMTGLNLTVWHAIYGSDPSFAVDIIVLILGAAAQSFVFGAALFGHERLLSRFSERRNATILGDVYEERKKLPSFLDQLGREQLFVRIAIAGVALAGCFYLLAQQASILSFKLGLMIALSFLIDLFWAPILVSAAFMFAGALSNYGGISGSLMAVGSLVCIEICFFQWLVFRIKESDRIPGIESPATIFTSEWFRPAGVLAFLLVLSFLVTPTLDYRPKEDKGKDQRGLARTLHKFVWYMGKSPSGNRGRPDAKNSRSSISAFTSNKSSSIGEQDRVNSGLTRDEQNSSGSGAGTKPLPLTKPTIDLPLQPNGGRISSPQLQRLLNTNISMPQQLGGGKLNIDSLGSFDKGDVEIRLSGSPVGNSKVSSEYYELARDLVDFREMQGSANPQPQLQKRLQQSIKKTAENLQRRTTSQDLTGVNAQVAQRLQGAGRTPLSSGGGAPSSGPRSGGGSGNSAAARSGSAEETTGTNAVVEQQSFDEQQSDSASTRKQYEEKKKQQKEKRRRRDILVVMAAAALVLGAIWLALSGRNKRDKGKRTRPKKVSGRRLKAARSAFHQHLFEITQKHPSLAEQVIAAYNGLLGFYRMIGLEKPMHYTPDEYMHALSSRLPQKRQPLNQVTGMFLHTLYGRQEPTQAKFQQYMLAIRELSKVDKI